MSNDRGVRLDFEVNLGNSDRNLNALERKLKSAEEALQNARDAANDLEARLNSVNTDVKVKVGVDVDDQEVTSLASLLGGIQDETVNIDIEANDLSIIENDIQGLSDETVNINIETSDDDVLTQLNALNGTIDLIVNIGGTALSFVETVGSFAVGGILEMDTALARLEGTTGQIIPGAEYLINDLYTGGWGESRAAIGEVISTASRLGIEQEKLGAATETAFQVANVTGGDVNETLRVMQSLVTNGLVPDYEAAGDVMVAGFQNGLDRAGDLNDTLLEYGTTFSALGLDADEAMGLLNQGLDAGIVNTDFIADSLREFNILLQEVDNVDVQAALSNLGLEDAAADFRDGTLAGDEFMAMVLDGLREIEDPAERATTAISLFGTQFEDADSETFIQALDPLAATLGDIEGAAVDASDAIDANLGTALLGLKRTLEVELQDAINNTFDISGMIEDAQSAIAAFFDNLESGGSLGESIGIAIDVLNMPILEDFQQTLSNLAIGMLQAAGSIVRATGGDASGIREAIEALAGGQLEIDVQVANNGQEIINNITTALGRGVEEANIGETLNTAFETALSRGDFDLAAQLRDAAAGIDSGALFQDSNLAFAVDSEAIAASWSAAIAEANTQINAALASGDLGTALDLASAIGDETQVQAIREQLQATFNEAIASGDFEAAAALAEPIQAVIETLSQPVAGGFGASVESEVSTATEQVALLQAGLDALGGTSVTTPTVVDEETSDGIVQASEAITGFRETAERETALTTSALSSVGEIVSGVSSDYGTALVSMKDTTTQNLTQVNTDLDKGGRAFGKLADTSNTELPKISTAMGTLQNSVTTNETLITAAFARMQTQIAATVTAIAGLPQNLGGTAAAVNLTVPAPTQAGGTTGGSLPIPTAPIPGSSGSGTTAPGGFPNTAGAGSGADMIVLPIGASGNTVTTVNNVKADININTTSEAAAVSSGYAVAQAIKGF